MALGALGVVFGDIGTSPLYAFRECFAMHTNVALTSENILGVLSLILWSLILAISVKYMAIVMRADNRGEGGILSLMALASSNFDRGTKRHFWILMLGVFGAALLYGDGVITPAVSVLGAVEGLELIAPGLENLVVPITCIVIALLFVVQRLGTGWIGNLFGPLILIWFLIIGFLGVTSIIDRPDVLAAVNPMYGFQFMVSQGWMGPTILGAVVLVITGGEALYADMGHFGKHPIRLAWFIVAMPCLVLNYFGQGALLLKSPEAISNPFYLLAPSWFLPPLVIIATLAATIASQALISGIFSLSKQAVQLGFCPRVKIVHTSSREIGQIYIPFINWALFVGVIWLVVSFKSSSALASAYGLAVTATMVLTTILAFIVALKMWKWSLPLAIFTFGFFLIIDLAFLAPNLMKIPHGGWVPLLIGAFVHLLMTTWKNGRRMLAETLKARSMPISEFITRITENPPTRVSGTAIYMSSEPTGVPIPLLHNLKHNKVIHERVILLTISTQEVPFVSKNERVQLDLVGPNLYRIVARYGFMEIPKIKHILDACRSRGLDLRLDDSTFVLGRETILPSSLPGMAIWRENLFAIMSRNAQRPTAFFKIPPNQVIEVGIQIEI